LARTVLRNKELKKSAEDCGCEIVREGLGQWWYDPLHLVFRAKEGTVMVVVVIRRPPVLCFEGGGEMGGRRRGGRFACSGANWRERAGL